MVADTLSSMVHEKYIISTFRGRDLNLIIYKCMEDQKPKCENHIKWELNISKMMRGFKIWY